MNNKKVSLNIKNFGREVDIYLTNCESGQYYYAETINNRLEWTRQVHTSEAKPLLSLDKETALLLVKTIIAELDN